MALTQTATIPGPGPSWDEEVVPALRKRLQNESRTIARRISAISVTSADDAVNTAFANDYIYRDHISVANSYQGAPAPARPRPSLEQTRAGSDNRVNPTKPPSTRSRTYSQPWPSETKQNGRHNGSAVARAVSPRQEPRPTRIPKPARSRAGSTSSHSYSLNGSAASPYSSPKSPQPDPDLFILHERPAAASRSTISVNSRQDSGLLHEPPPFRAGSATSSNDNSSDNNRRVMELDPPRPSIDSEERPYEHWYRGDISRNGGVGELKVAKRQEMLEIANYGHSLRANQGPRNAITDALEEGRRRRRRADSVGPTNRQSFYMEEDDGFVQVKDESPLTDLEGSDPGHTSDYHTPVHSYHEGNSSASASASTPGLPMYIGLAPTSQRPSSRQQQQSRIPTPTREPPRTTTPTQMSRGLSEPPSLPSTSTPKSTAKRAASPQISSAMKKSRTQAAKATRARTEAAKKERDEAANRRSIAHYPTPGDDMRDAIPSWTQPVPRQGNWDDVVIPVVARNKGLDGYEHADGSPRARQVESIIAPAPGTFGYDHSKYRPPRHDDPSSIPMDEFGLRQVNGGIVEEEEDEPHHAPPPISTNHDRTPLPVRMQPPSSPVPFSHYAPNATVKLQPVSTDATKLEVQEASHHQQPEEDDAGGCCSCVVM